MSPDVGNNLFFNVMRFDVISANLIYIRNKKYPSMAGNNGSSTAATKTRSIAIEDQPTRVRHSASSVALTHHLKTKPE